MSLILGIETSCDETAAAVVRDGRWVLSSIIATQHELHQPFGGVVPEIASRAHLERILPTLNQALHAASISWNALDAIAVGNRPGLIGSLLVGVSAAKALAWILEKPLIGIDHVQAHLYAPFLQPPTNPNTSASSSPASSSPWPPPESFPALGLVVSGGHTNLYRLDSPLSIHLLGRTIDDAVGEAYDKAAVILGLPYPGGPHLDRLAQQGDPSRFDLPRSLLGPDSLDFSFSGLKTALLYKVRGLPVLQNNQPRFLRSAADLSDQDRRDLAAAFQEAAIDILIRKLHRALDHLAQQNIHPRTLLIGGGVCANSLLRRRALEWGRQTGLRVLLSPLAYCPDNAAMIAGLAHHRLTASQLDDLYLPAFAAGG